jgi:hypothetical protein
VRSGAETETRDPAPIDRSGGGGAKDPARDTPPHAAQTVALGGALRLAVVRSAKNETMSTSMLSPIRGGGAGAMIEDRDADDGGGVNDDDDDAHADADDDDAAGPVPRCAATDAALSVLLSHLHGAAALCRRSTTPSREEDHTRSVIACPRTEHRSATRQALLASIASRSQAGHPCPWPITRDTAPLPSPAAESVDGRRRLRVDGAWLDAGTDDDIEADDDV